jgi:hypothetical protein
MEVRGKRADFEPLISEELFYRVQSVLSGRVPVPTPQQRAHPDLPLRALVRVRVLWTSNVGNIQGTAVAQPSKCRFAKARPEPDFR